MKQYTRAELAEELKIPIGEIIKNFPKTAAKQLQKGIKIIKEGKGESSLYIIEYVEPQKIDKSSLSSRKPKLQEEEGEQWINCFQNDDYEVSNLGRIRLKKTQYIQHGTLNTEGYVEVSLGGHKKARLHRLILQSFNPQEDYENLTVDHINGIRSDNKLENLKWNSIQENVASMMKNRADLNIELTRIIQKYGYEKTLLILKNL